jgi:maltooligosyltrehalose trehalohydrolase
VTRRLPIGAELAPDGGRFRVWAPRHSAVSVVLESGYAVGEHALSAESHGYFAATVARAKAGDRYRFRLGEGEAYPDPASRFQPEGPHGPSEVVDPSAFEWTCRDWAGVALTAVVLYEMHIGTFTREGTWAAAIEQLPELAALGVTVLEVMPVHEFPGRFGWGYDGVNLFAPTRLYGRPDDFRRFVDAAHRHGLGVILDVVYNHFGPDGNYLGQYSRDYFTDRYETEWGEAINYDGENSDPVRDFVLANVAHWIDEYRLDGLRLDATQNIYDRKPPAEHLLTEIGRVARRAAPGRRVVMVNENERQHAELVRPVERGGYGLDMLWNDDYHHSVMVALTGRAEAYYTDYRGDAQEFVSAAQYGYLYQGQYYSWQECRRGHPGFDLPPAAFVNFFQNHDQVANSGRGLRAHHLTSPGRYRAAQALTLLGPGTPMLFMGQEFAASAPFHYFADHQPDLAELVRAGRFEFLKQFRSLNDTRMREVYAAPHDAAGFERCKLDFAERETHAADYRLTKDLLRLRREDPAFRAQAHRGVGGAVLSPQAFVLRYFQPDGLDRLLVVNFGRDLHLLACPVPLLAPPWGCHWAVALATEDPAYGGHGAENPDVEGEGWRVAGEAAVALVPQPGKPTAAPERRTGADKRGRADV